MRRNDKLNIIICKPCDLKVDQVKTQFYFGVCRGMINSTGNMKMHVRYKRAAYGVTFRHE